MQALRSCIRQGYTGMVAALSI